MDVEWKKLVKEARRQGWRLEHGRRGQLKLIPPEPDKGIVILHRTPSDRRAFRNAVGEMRRRGLAWPPPRKGER